MYFGFQNMTIGFHGKTVLEDVTLDIPRGKVITIIGQNGCGKSSLLKTVSKAVTPRMGGGHLQRQAAEKLSAQANCPAYRLSGAGACVAAGY